MPYHMASDVVHNHITPPISSHTAYPYNWLSLLYSLTQLLKLPPGYTEEDRLCFFIFEQSPEMLQKLLCQQPVDHRSAQLLTHPNQYLQTLIPTHLTDALETFPLSGLHQPDLAYHEDEDDPYDKNTMADDFDADNDDNSFSDADQAYLDWFDMASSDHEHHYDHITAKAIQVSMPSLLNTATSASILYAPRTERLNRLSPHHFRIAFCRQLQIPIMQKRQKCKCGCMIDIF
eukprot:5572985-Ditylum_brightwellii.AAC.1